MPNPSCHSFSSLAGLSSFLPPFFHSHSTTAAAAATAGLANYSLFSFLIITTFIVIVFSSLFVLATPRGPMPPRSKIPVAVTMPTKSPDKLKSPSPVGSLIPKETKKPVETPVSTQIKAPDEQKQHLQIEEEQEKNGTKSKSPSPSPTRANSLLRRSSRRIPERQHEKVVPLPAAKDIHGLGRVTPPTDGDDIKPGPTVKVREVDPDSSPDLDGPAISPISNIRKQDDLPDEPGEEEDLDKPFELFGESDTTYTETVTVTPPDSPENLFSHKQPFPTTIRPLASRSGFSARMDTISERSTEFESSDRGNSRPVSLSSSKDSPRPESLQVEDFPPSPPPKVESPAKTKEEEVSSPTSPSPPTPPTPSPPPLPAPAPAAIIQQKSTDTLNLEADFRAIGTYLRMNTISNEHLTIRTSSRGSMRLPREASCQSIDSVLNGSVLSLSTSQTDSVQERLRMDLMAARGIPFTLTRLQLPDNIIDTSNPFAPLAGSSRSSSIHTNKTLKPEPAHAANQQGKGIDESATNVPVSEHLEQVGKELSKDNLPDPDNEPSLFRQPDQSGTEDVKHVPRHPRSTQVHRTAISEKHGNPFQLPQISKTASGTKLGLDFGIPMSSSSSVYSSHSSTATDKRGGYEDGDEQDSNDKAEGYRVNHSCAATLTCSLVSALHNQERQQRNQHNPQYAEYVGDKPIEDLIRRFHAEETLFIRRIVSFTCDPRAATAASFVSSPQRKVFKRAQQPVSDLAFEVQRYCLKYVGGFDLSWHIKRIQAVRQRQALGSGMGNRGERDLRIGHTGAVRSQISGHPRKKQGGSWASKRISLLERECGCDRGSCSSAGSSTGRGHTEIRNPQRILNVEVDTKPLVSLFEDAHHHQLTDAANSNDRDKYPDDGTEMPAYMSRPPTPPRGKESPGRLQSYGFWQRMTGQGKGKRVDRPVPDESAIIKSETGPHDPNGGDENSRQSEGEAGVPQPQKKKEKKQRVYDDCPRLPKLELISGPGDSDSQQSQAMTSTPSSSFKSRATTASETPTTPRTHLSSPLPEDHLPPPPPPPLTEQDSLTIQHALKTGIEAVWSLRNFMDLLEDTYYEAQPEPVYQSEFAHPSTPDYRVQPYAYNPHYQGERLGRYIKRTPAQAAAYTKYQGLVSRSEHHITAGVLVLDKQTRIIKGVLDAAEGLETEGDPGTGHKHLERSSTFPALLRKGRNSSPPPGDGDGCFMMSGGLPKPDSLCSSVAEFEYEDGVNDADSRSTRAEETRDKHTSRHASSDPGFMSLLQRHSNKLGPDKRQSIITRRATHPGTDPKFTYPKLADNPPNGHNRKKLADLLNSHILSAKLSYTCARAEFIALKQMARFSSLDKYTYRSLMRFESRLEELEDELLGLDNRRCSSSSGNGVGTVCQEDCPAKRGSSGIFDGSDTTGYSGPLTTIADISTAPGTSSSDGDFLASTGNPSNRRGRRGSPSHRESGSSVNHLLKGMVTSSSTPRKDRSSRGVLYAQGDTTNTPASSPSKTLQRINTSRQNDSPKSGRGAKIRKNNPRESTLSMNQRNPTTKKMRQALQKMRQSTQSIVNTIIARRKGRRIGIADTEERQSLNSQEWDWFDSATGEVVYGGSGIGSGSLGIGSAAGFHSGWGAKHARRRLDVQHEAGCPYGGDPNTIIYGCNGNRSASGSGSGSGSGSRTGSGGTGLGLGIGRALGGASAVKSSPETTHSGSGSGRKTYSNREDNTTTGSSPPSIPVNISPGSSRDGWPQQRCPGCGVDLVIPSPRDSRPVPRIASDGLPHASQGGPSQIGWVRRVMGPRGRKRAARYFFYKPSFGTPLVNGKEQYQQDQSQNGSSDPRISTPIPRLEDHYEETEPESPSPSEGRGRRKKRTFLSQHDDTYYALIGRGRETEPATTPERHGTPQGRQRRRLVRNRDRRQVISDITGDRDRELRLIESHRRHAESIDLARTSWAHMEHAAPDDDGGLAGGEGRNTHVNRNTDDTTVRIGNSGTIRDSGVGLQRRSADSNEDTGGGRSEPQRGSLFPSDLTRTRSVKSTRSAKSTTATCRKDQARGSGSNVEGNAPITPPSPGPSRGRTRVRNMDLYGFPSQGVNVVNGNFSGDRRSQPPVGTEKMVSGEEKRRTV